MITIQGVVVTTIRDTKVVIEEISVKAKRPMNISAIDTRPMSIVARGRLKRGNTLEKSKPVPYSDVVPVDMPLKSASRNSGAKNANR